MFWWCVFYTNLLLHENYNNLLHHKYSKIILLIITYKRKLYNQLNQALLATQKYLLILIWYVTYKNIIYSVCLKYARWDGKSARTIRYLESIGLLIKSIYSCNITDRLNVIANLGFILNSADWLNNLKNIYTVFQVIKDNHTNI